MKTPHKPHKHFKCISTFQFGKKQIQIEIIPQGYKFNMKVHECSQFEIKTVSEDIGHFKHQIEFYKLLIKGYEDKYGKAEKITHEYRSI